MKQFFVRIKTSVLAVVLLAVATMANAQNAGFNYQAVVRNAQGELVSNANVGLRITLTDERGLQAMYSETQTVATNAYGVLSVTVGAGTPADNKTLDSVDWAGGNVWMRVEMDTKGGTNYTDMGLTKLQSVPFAYFAANAKAEKGEKGDKGADGADGVGIASVSNNEGLVTITLTDGNEYAYNLKGAKGDTGAQGAQGPKGDDGVDGNDGVGIDSVSNNNGLVTFTLTDGNEYTYNLKGDKGDPGRDGMQVDGTAGQTLVHNGTTWVATDELSVAKLDVSKLNVKPDSVAANDTINEPLFAVKDRNGNIVFAVYPDGVRVYVDEQTKARRSGFVVTGRSASKDGADNDFFSIDAEGTHIYVDDTATTKAWPLGLKRW